MQRSYIQWQNLNYTGFENWSTLQKVDSGDLAWQQKKICFNMTLYLECTKHIMNNKCYGLLAWKSWSLMSF